MSAGVAESLAAPRPALWVEVSPPRGVNPDLLLRRLAALRGQVDAINLTDNALGRVKMSGLVFASFIKARLEIPVVLNVSCRDRNRFALKSDLLGAGALGIEAVVALTGDKIAPSDPDGASAVHDLDLYGLLAMIAMLNRGDTGEGKEALKTRPALYGGSVANPYRENFEREIEILERRFRAGAKFVLTQPIFDAETARRFLAHARRIGIAVMFGILPIKRPSMAKYMQDKVRDLSGARAYLERYAGMSEAAARAFSIHGNLELMKSLGHEAAGFAIMSGGGPSLAIELALEFSKWRKAVNP
ncbi:MAG TPA: methylenetetrahydrofolate reductase [Candidatus Binataceae bacterium]|nr:methylenetetrahydrofolate reductase [Candidatus Binataceae bacterium]